MQIQKVNIFPEILAPAGNKESLKAAIIGKADAVYIGINEFNARQGAQNFTLENLEENIDFAHLYNLKVFLTLNVPIKEHEINYVFEIINKIYAMGIDAIIVEDLGIVNLIKQIYKNDLPVHISTQVTVHNTLSMHFLENLGVSRVVLSRELTIPEIKQIVKHSTLESEIFVHGALCYSYSGRCLFSSFVMDRSANRGSCGQPCRRKFKLFINNKFYNLTDSLYLLSCAELCTLEGMKEILDTKVTSLKIEGRMKKPEYVTMTATLYKEAIKIVKETGKNIDNNNLNLMKLKLAKLFYRGFTPGFILGKNDVTHTKYSSNAGIFLGLVEDVIFFDNNAAIKVKLKVELHVNDGISIHTTKKTLGSKIYDIQLIDGTTVKTAKEGATVLLFISNKTAKAIKVKDEIYLSTDYNYLNEINQYDLSKIPIDIVLIAYYNNPLKIIISYNKHTIEYTDAYIVEKSIKTSLSADKIREIFNKLGDTSYTLDSFKIQGDTDIFIPLGVLTAARRNAIDILTNKIIQKFKPQYNLIYDNKVFKNEDTFYIKHNKKILLSVYVNDINSLIIAAKNGANIIYIDISQYESFEKIDSDILKLIIDNNIEIVFVTPQITHDVDIEKLLPILNEIKDKGYKIACANLGTIQFAIQNGMPYTIQKDIKIFNSYSANLFFSLGSYRICLSSELNMAEIQSIRKSIQYDEFKQIEVFVHGREQMLITKNNLLSLSSIHEEEINNAFVEDQYGNRFPIKNKSKYIKIYDSKVLNMVNNVQKLVDIGIDVLYLDLSFYHGKAIRDIIRNYKLSLSGKKIKPIIYKNETKSNGHFFKGV